jgi:type III secretion protein V
MPGSSTALRTRPRRPYADVALAVLLLLIVGLMIIPVPTPLLDVLIASNIALAVVMLLVSMAVQSGLGFGAMPTVLLVTTLYRLALNVSSTRLILLQADAGRVIQAFGEYVVRGNYAVGAVIFFVLTLIQYVVVARGSERVAEVGARFTLDAMPGKQMAIDAELRAGAISPDEARASRRALARENQFYGAMDGAMKFVKGDAIAGIAITLINVVAGVAIGVFMRDMGALQSLRTYGLLAIGDGLVCQVPALLISTSAGLVVTRVASHAPGASLGDEVRAQLFGNRRVLWMAALFLGLLALVPGLPAVPFAVLALVLGAMAYGLRHVRSPELGGDERKAEPRFAPLSPLSVELGPELERSLGAPELLPVALERVRERSALELGLPLREIPIRTRPELAAGAYQLRLDEVPALRAELAEDGDPHRACSAIANALFALTRKHAHELLGYQETQQLLDALERGSPALVRSTVPKPVSLKLLTQVLRGLLAEQISIRPLAQILEVLADEGQSGASAEILLERTRLALRRHIVFAYAPEGTLAIHPVDGVIEDAIRDAQTPSGLPLPPEQAAEIVEAARHATGGEAGRGVLVTQPDVRAPLRRLLESALPQLAVLAYPELVPEVPLERCSPVRIGKPPRGR